MNRITVEQVERAYEATGLHPVYGNFLVENKHDQIVAGCALTACAWSDHPCFIADYYDVLGITPSYMYGFTLGFDGITPMAFDFEHYDRDEVLAGHEDGDAAREAIKPTYHRDHSLFSKLPGIAVFDKNLMKYVRL